MKTFELECSRCRAALAVPLTEASTLSDCPSCGAALQIEVFPALLRPVAQGQTGESLVLDDESSCFYHPGKKAVLPCESCGRFLCALCDVEFAGRHLCPACIESGIEMQGESAPKKDTFHYDEVALTLALAPLLLFWMTLVTAPITIFFVIRYWKKPLGIGRRSRWRFVAAFLFALAELTGWGIAAAVLIGQWNA